ncbi:MAG: ribosomal RNA small subunit methyltransferase A [Acidobacteria bacterium]|nr:MAG: ribosomal RNA small subunit methyltransferase A [Acidobacteriota bacterium]
MTNFMGDQRPEKARVLSFELVPFFPTRSKGQCFLTDHRYVERIVEAIAPATEETLLEIGAGEGQLTLPMLDRGARIVAVEADKRLAEKLLARAASDERLDVLQQDALKVDFLDVMASRKLERTRVYGNLPYSIAAPILFKLISAATAFKSLTLMFQKEVAERLVASPSIPAYSFLSVVAQQAAQIRVLFSIPPEAFRPRPRVVSSLVAFELRHDRAPDYGNETTFRALVKGLLAHRRKTIRNNIKHLHPTGVSPERMREALEQLGIDPSRRAETLSVQEFAELGRICASPA